MTDSTGHSEGGNGAEGLVAQRPPSAYFTSLSVRNFRCFGDEVQTVSCADGSGRPARWTILLGDNGTGKTSLLQCFAAFAPSLDVEKPPSQAWTETFGYPAKGMPKLLSDQERRLIVSNALEGRPLTANAKTVVGERFSARRKNLSEESLQYNLSRHTTKDDAAIVIWTANFRPLAAFPRCYAYGASRRLSTVALSEEGSADSTASLFSDDVVLRNAEEWLLKLDYSASKSSSIQSRQKKRLQEITKLLVDVLPDVDEVRFATPSGARPNPSVEFHTPFGWVPLRHLGQGYRSSVSWIVDFASRMVEDNPDSKAPLSEPAVALIDEIDLHLHPVWQRSLLGHLTRCFPNTQFIATAHSPLVVQAVEDANLVLLKREGSRVVIQNDLQAVKGWRVDQVLTSDLFGLESVRPPQYDALLKERKAILTKSTISPADAKRLKEIDAEVGTLPAGDADTILRVQALLVQAKRIAGAK